MSCPCGNDAELAACCGRFLSGAEHPATAEELMRSRYTAYVENQIDYVVESHEPKTRDDVDRDAADSWSKQAEWTGLEVRETREGGPEDQRGEVEFVARYRVQGADLAHHEVARFERQNDRWYYVDGDIVKAKPVVRDAPKVGRNEPCPCGSGKKFKKCCA